MSKVCCKGFARAERRIEAATHGDVVTTEDREDTDRFFRLVFSGTGVPAETQKHLAEMVEQTHLLLAHQATAAVEAADDRDEDEAFEDFGRVADAVVAGMLIRAYLAGFETRRAMEAQEQGTGA